MLSLAHVSSMKTSRVGSSVGWNSPQSARAWATSGRSCWAARRLFFEGQLLAVAEPPHRAIAHHKSPLLGQLVPQFFQGEIRLGFDPFQQPLPVRPFDPRPPAAAHRLWGKAPPLGVLVHPAGPARNANTG